MNGARRRLRNGALTGAAVFALLLCAAPARAMFEDDPLLLHWIADEFELRREDGESHFNWDVELRAGRDLHKARLIAEGERHDGETQESETRLLYSRALTPFGNIEFGLRSTALPRPRRDWLVLGARWLLPWFWETEISLFVGEHGQNALRLETETEWLLQRRLALRPHLRLDFHEEKDPLRNIGSGLSTSELGLRLEYMVRREFNPYFGLHWEKSHGDSADFRRRAGEDAETLEWLAGVHFWW